MGKGKQPNWGIIISNGNFKPPVFKPGDRAVKAKIEFARTIAHEVGHFFNLAHRDEPNPQFPNDGLDHPKDKNLMDQRLTATGTYDENVAREDLDLLQAYAVHQIHRIEQGG